MESKIDAKWGYFFDCFLGVFFIDFCSILGHLGRGKSLRSAVRVSKIRVSGFCLRERFQNDFRMTLGWFLGSKIDKKNDGKHGHFFDRFLTCIFIDFELKMDPQIESKLSKNR